MRICAKCNRDLDLTDFYFHNGKPHSRQCKDCLKAQIKAHREANLEAAHLRQKELRARPEEQEKARLRTRAWREKNPERARESSRKWELANPEKSREYHRKWRQEHPERIRERTLREKLKRLFGLTLQQYEDLLASQRGACAMCRAPRSKNGNRLAVDHDSKTGEIRGLLCQHCNLALGYLDHDPQIATAAAAYLLQSGSGLYVPK